MNRYSSRWIDDGSEFYKNKGGKDSEYKNKNDDREDKQEDTEADQGILNIILTVIGFLSLTRN